MMKKVVALLATKLAAKLALVAPAVLGAGWFAEALVAAPQSGQGPSARFFHSMAYDSVREVVVLFGGTTNNSWPSGVLSDTWEWDGSTWTERFPANAPSPRAIGSMCFDASRGVCVYFGGAYIPGNPNNETWEWDGVDWVQAAPGASPPARRSHSMTYDALRQRVVMAGSTNGSFVQDDFWEYDGHTWMPISGGSTQVSGPSARASVVLAYGQVVGGSSAILFGGETQTSSTLGDTWKWDGTSWLQLSPANSPPPTAASALAYDTAAGHFALFGGRTASGVTNATWIYGINDWTHIMPTISPAARQSHQIVYDQVRHEYLMFGGWSGTSALGDTWTFDGSEWRPKLDYVTSPVNGSRYALTPPMTWQEAENLAVLEGGHLATVRSQAEQDWLWSNFGPDDLWIGFNDEAVEGTWVWSSGEAPGYTNWNPGEPNGNATSDEDYCHLYNSFGANGRWNDHYSNTVFRGIIELPGGPVAEVTTTPLTTTATPSPVRDHAIAALPSGGALLFGGETASGPFFSTYELHGTDWTQQFPNFSPATRKHHTLILDRAAQNNVMFGGENPLGAKLADTWTYQNGQWSLATPANAPAARSRHAMAYDPTTDTGILFGGEDAIGTALADMWTWDGTDWTQITPATMPPARFGHGLAWDRLRNRLVLFGGNDGSVRLDDVWEWDGTNWTQITPAQPNGITWGPGPRDQHSMAFDPRAQCVVVHGGEGSSSCSGDLWLWDGTAWTRLFDPAATMPQARSGGQLLHDEQGNRLLLHGGGCGTTLFDDLTQFAVPVLARATPYGTGCGSVGLTMSADPTAPPILGTTAKAQITGVVSPILNGALGLSNQTALGLPLPVEMTVLGFAAPGCFLNASFEISYWLPTTSTGAGTSDFAFSLPNLPQLLGLPLYAQVWNFDPGYNGANIATSNGLEWILGDT